MVSLDLDRLPSSMREDQRPNNLSNGSTPVGKVHFTDGATSSSRF